MHVLHEACSRLGLQRVRCRGGLSLEAARCRACASRTARDVPVPTLWAVIDRLYSYSDFLAVKRARNAARSTWPPRRETLVLRRAFVVSSRGVAANTAKPARLPPLTA